MHWLTNGKPKGACSTVQGGKIHCCLMIEKVVDRIGELDEPHLKLVVIHDFILALIEEQASDGAHQHQVKNWDSGWDICQVESEACSILQDVIA